MSNPKNPRKAAHISKHFIRRLSSWIVLSTALTLSAAKVAHASTLYWDPDTVPGNNVFGTQAGLGGAGTWNATNVNWWDGSSATDTLWASGNIASFGGTAGGALTLGSPISVGGLAFTTSGYTTVLTASNTITLGAGSVIAADANATIGTAAVNGILGTNGFTMSGGGTLTVVGANTGLTGAITVASGTLVSSGNASALGTAQPITLDFGTLSLLNNGAGSSSATAISYGDAVTVNGNSTINVNNAGSNANNTISIATLNLNNSQLTVTNGNSYGLQVTGSTTLGGPITTISTGLTFTANNANPTSNMLALSGGVTGGGALNKQGSGTVNLFGANTYTGGTNIFAGAVTLANSTATAGTGNIIVNPGAALAVTNAANVTFSGGQTLAVESAANSFGILRLDSTASNIVTGSSLGSMFVSPYGAAFQLNTGSVNYNATGVPGAAATYTQNINLANIGASTAGNGPVFLGAASNTTMSGTILPSGGVYRIGANATTGTVLTLSGSGALTGASNVIVGSPMENVQGVANASGTVAISNANSGLTGTITINKGSAVQVTGTSTASNNPLGTGTVNIYGGNIAISTGTANQNAAAGTLDTTATNYTGTAPYLGNTLFDLYQGGILQLNDTAVTTVGGTTNLRLSSSATINSYSGVFNLLASNTATTTTAQTIGTYNAAGGNIIADTQGSGTNANASLTIANLNRVGNGTIALTHGANVYGATQTQFAITNLNGSAPLATNGMIAPWLVDATTFSFFNYASGSLQTLGTTYGSANNWDVNASTAALLQGATATQKVDVTAAAALSASANVYALRVGNFALTNGSGANTITINGNATDGAGLILNSTAAQTDTVNFTFGVTGNVEAIIYATTAAQTTTLSGSVAANGLTKFGPGTLALTGTNTGVTTLPSGLGNAAGSSLQGTITLNQGVLNATPAGANFRPVTVNAGDLQFNTASLFLNDITFAGDASIDTGTNLQPRYNSLTVAARSGSTDPITIATIAGGLVSNQGLTLNGALNLNHVTGGNQWVLGNFGLASSSLSGTGALNKWGAGQVILVTSSPSYTGAITINGIGGNNNNALIRSQDAGATDTPFGSGAVVVNPGGVVSLAHPANLVGNSSVTLNSDLNGLATVALSYNGNATLPTNTFTFNNTNLAGPFSAVLAVDSVGFSGAIDLSAATGFGNGLAFLGSANATGNVTGSITPSTTNLTLPNTGTGGVSMSTTSTGVYRIGAGGGTTQFLGSGQFASGNDIEVGAISNVHQYSSVSLANGNGTAAIYNLNSGFNGTIVLNGSVSGLGQGNLIVGNDNALGSGTILFDGGGIQADTGTGLPFNDPTRTIGNAIVFAGDALFNGATDLKFTANFGLAPGQSGVTRVFNAANTTGVTTFTGNISDGTGGSLNSITKTGTGFLQFTGSNTYSGYTNINAGEIIVTGDSSISSNSTITLGGGFLGAWSSTFTTNRNYILTASGGGFDVGPGQTVTQSNQSNISGAFTFNKSGLGNMVLNGVNSQTATQVNAGELWVGSNVALGDIPTNGAIILNSAPSATVVPATLVVTNSFTSGRAINSVSNSSGVVSVQSGQTFTDTGVINLGTGLFTKAGFGTLVTTGTNTGTAVAVQAGIWQSANNQPFGLGAAVDVNGGTLLLQNTTAINAIAGTGTMSFGGGGHLALQSAATFSDQITEANINRSVAGTLIIDPGTSTLGVAGNTNDVRVIPSTQINGVAVASANVNGILPANIITQTGGIGSFATYLSSAAGIGTFTGYTAAGSGSFVGSATTLTDVTAPITSIPAGSTGPNVIPGAPTYGFRTNSNISGGSLRIGSVSSTNEGGIIVNGTVNIGANLTFDPTIATGTAASGEGLLYVNPGGTATLSGGLLATSLVKFGTGTLVLAPTASSQAILGQLTVQEGTLQLSGVNFNKFQTDLVLNGAATTLDLNGQNLAFDSLANSAGVTGTVGGGIIGNSSTSAAGTLTIVGASGVNTTFAGNIVDAVNGGNQTTALVKEGASTLVLGIAVQGQPDASNNTYTGGTTLYGYDSTAGNQNGALISNTGVLTVQNPLGLGTGAVNLDGGTLSLLSNGGGINGTIILGNQTGIGSTVNVEGPSIINVDRVAANTGNSWQIGNLNMTENALDVTGGDSYHLRVAGTTTILGNYASFITGTTSSSGTTELAGLITGSGALDKYGADISRMLLIDNGGNSYSGGTNIISGNLIVNTASGTPLGTGRVNVFPSGMLTISGLGTWASGTIGGAPVVVNSYVNSAATIGLLNDNFDPTTWLGASGVFNNAYGTSAVSLNRPFWTRALDQSAFGDGRTFLTPGIVGEVDYIASNLIPGLGDGTAARIYRLGSGAINGQNLAFTGADNVLNDLAAPGTMVQIGSPTSIMNNGALTNLGNSSGNTTSVIIRNSNDYTGGTIVWKGSVLQIETGASPGANNSPLGTGAVDVWGTLQTSGQNGSFVNASTGNNNNVINLHPGGLIVINDVAGTVTGGQGRWADATGINLNGGSFQFTGATGYGSSETIGTVTVDKLGRIIVSKGSGAGTAQLNIAGLTRVTASGSTGAGALLLQGSGNGTLGMVASATISNTNANAFDRIVITGTAPTLGGNVSIGAGITAGIATAGMAAPWIINTNDPLGVLDFVTYSPGASNTGFQPLVTIGSPGAGTLAANGTFTPGANQVGYSKVFGGGTAAPTIGAGQLTASDTVDLNGNAALTLADVNTSVYALRTNQNILPATSANPSLTIVSGGLLAVTNNVTINPNAVGLNLPNQAMTLNFGVGGNAEAVIGSTVTVMTINAQIVATGLTRIATQGSGANLILTGDNLLSGPVTLDGGIIQAQNTLSGIGSVVPGVFNGQNVILGGAANAGADRIVLDARVGTSTTSVLASGVQATSRFSDAFYVNGDSEIDTNNASISQHIASLTMADLGAEKPIALTLSNGVYVEGTTTLGTNNQFNVVFQNFSSSTFGGLVQGGTLNKYGNATLLMAGTANTYAATVINEAAANTATSIVGSLTRSGSPFGSGPITINPGAELRIMDPSNIAGNTVNLKTDGEGIGGIGLAVTMSQATIAGLFGSGAGLINVSSTGDQSASVALDANSWNNAVNIGGIETAIGNSKPVWLGSSMNPVQIYFNSGSVNYNASTLTAGAGNTLRIGGGGNQGSIALGVGQFENVLTGNETVMLSASTAGLMQNGPLYVNGNIGSLVLDNRDMGFTGTVVINAGGNINIQNAYALGSGTIQFNGSAALNNGGVQIGNNQTVPNAISVTGDLLAYLGGTNATLSGNVNLAPSGTGGTRVFFDASTATGFTGVISDAGTGTGMSNIIFSGNNNNNGGSAIFHGANTYHGTTTITSGLLYAATDVTPNVAGALGISDTPILLGNVGTNSAGQFALAGQFNMGRDIIATGQAGNNFNLVRLQSMQYGTITGSINTTISTAGGGLALDAVSTANGVGGILDVKGQIVGAGALQIGGGGAGVVRLSSNANGFGINTFSGGVNIWGGRLQINADTYFTGSASSPTIISGPLGTGTLFLGRQGTTTSGVGNQAPTFVENRPVRRRSHDRQPLGCNQP
ncbi:autotransporter-associated beta strand repeat protein [Chthoniobacter flavus Ellin428]|uniref:Autotransporter-associated beta strand repeat protein n=1 Tax=Chthoniobacter flavus Ellin428 TaxID=497964 RepID=B4D7T7_9BACT|nr:autotransporter-associated beta strand repeat-containing protein [Chthoniobacter flavus]EDY17460.1 autotransporter-associated beta strand repeat protein [Chthoniobacter flavus Ellin428]